MKMKRIFIRFCEICRHTIEIENYFEDAFLPKALRNIFTNFVTKK